MITDSMTPNQAVEYALQLLRFARNNMDKLEFHNEVRRLCEDGNIRYPLFEAGTYAGQSHKEVVTALESK